MPTDDSLSVTLRQFGRLLEFTRDIERNENDASFVRDRGRIIYVFDENVFELFIHPRSRSRYVNSFHNNIWFENASVTEELQQISAQSALITSEYLFSGQLPGQENGAIYMTEWHFGELGHRRSEHSAEFREKIHELSKDKDSAATLIADAALDLSDVDKLTRADLQLFADRTRDVSALERFREARVAARQLARSDYVFPLLQLTRIGSKEIASRLAPLAARYRPSPDERAKILREDKLTLLKLMRQELQRREVTQERRRSDIVADQRETRERALPNDADSIAYIQWIARNKLGPRERIVLVTGDSLIFDVYRAWHLEHQFGEPFVLRRVSQFAPIINLTDALSDVMHHRELFQATREAVEAALFVFNLSGPSKDANYLHAGREHLALALAQHRNIHQNPALAMFFKNLTSEWVEERRDEFAALIKLWQNIERFIIGTHWDQITRRLDTAEWREIKASIATGSHEAYVSYLKKLLDDLVAGSIRLFFRFAVDFIRSAAYRESAEGNRLIRAPIALRLLIPRPASHDTGERGGVVFDDIYALFDSWRKQEPKSQQLFDISTNPTLAHRPDLVYAIAATLALEAGKWREAERFSDLARTADPMMEVPDAEIQETRFESIYLFAVSKRFRIGALNPTTSSGKTNIWSDLLQTAIESLTHCELYHARMGETRHQIRAISERAAARLFYACWAATISAEQLKARDFEFADAQKQFQLAIGDLRKCLELEPSGRKIDAADEQRFRFLARLERQYITNLAASQVMTHLFSDGPAKCHVDGLTSNEIDLISTRIEEWDANSVAMNLPLAAQTDLLAFKTLVRGDQSARIQLLECARQSRQLELALDRAFARAIAEIILR